MSPPTLGRPRSHRRRGFTLVELMIVILIISILVALTLTVIPKVKQSVYHAQTSAQMAALATAIQAYYGDFRAYPGPLPNSQVGITYYPATNYANAPQNKYVYVTDPYSGGPIQLQLGTGPLGTSETFNTFTQIQNITGCENLVLGLLGGLELKVDSTTTPYTVKTFAYSDASIFPDGNTPAPLGPLVLNPTAPKRLGAYIQVKIGDLSNSRSMSGPTVYTDEGGRVAADSPIPEFVDKYSTPMPILYLRANVGAKAIAGIGGKDDNGAALVDSKSAPVVPQYDISQVLGYTQSPSMGSAIGTNSMDPKRSHHGLQGLGTMTNSVTGDPSVPSGWYNAGKNALAYFKDPNNPGTSNTPDYTQSPAAYGYARQKDAFILISPGPDGLYGTADDVIYPGGSLTPQ